VDFTLVLLPLCGVLVLVLRLPEVIGFKVSFQGSAPAPGAVLANPPRAVAVWFTDAIDASSRVWVETLPRRNASTQGRRLLASAYGPDPANPVGSSLRVALPDSAPPGGYVVQWETRSHGGQRIRGALVFVVGAHDPKEVDDRVIERTVVPRHGGWPAVFGGVMCLALTPVFWWLQRRYSKGGEEKVEPDRESSGTWGEPPTR
jgi:methionine-rich copper-binding protein CopC